MTADEILRQALLAKGLRYVGVRGNPHCGVCVLGEAPGEHEDYAGFPFVGPSGWLADKMLKEVGLTAFFTNPYKTRPPDNKMPRLPELGIDFKLFHDQFFEEMNNYRPTIIVACGKTPTNLLCPETKPRFKKGAKQEEKEGFGNWRGSLLISPFLNWPHYVIPMYHPAFTLRNYGERETSIFILARAKEEFDQWRLNGKLTPLPVRRIIVNPSFGEAYDFLRRCIGSMRPISVDIELLRRRVPYTISFALDPFEAISLSFWNYDANQLVVLWKQINEILRRKRIIGQNFTSFDAHWLRAMGFDVEIAQVDDTLIRHHVLWPGLPHALHFQTMQYTREPYYKEEGKSWSPKEGLAKLMAYNCKDTLVTYEVYEKQEEEFLERAA